jgi:hypothetical protein
VDSLILTATMVWDLLFRLDSHGNHSEHRTGWKLDLGAQRGISSKYPVHFKGAMLFCRRQARRISMLGIALAEVADETMTGRMGLGNLGGDGRGLFNAG